MNQIQPDLFQAPPALPEGFQYWPDFLSADEERGLVERFADLPFKEFEFRGYRGNRRVLSFGWQYDFNRMELQRSEDMPAFLLPLRERAGRFAGLEAAEFQHVLLTEYAAGAGIGWHKDKPMFADVVGISLGSPCVFRFRRKAGPTWERASVVVEPRSAYLLQGPSRTEWEHSIPAVDNLRYSITFRNLKPSHQPER
ncbi:alpha-ketoglutarate-dependent dioxygenase AlkB [Microvirga makkahensis]|uniref:Alpha-ketoglutarate-dependent dioxygenase AlkB n=1 Tax=Microvirga makkahensis TaxID=1128670 RepID=A0A7X3SPC0_9HYPH|nr:alpha-ketoglutarate-dependent dioxygenase AlkB [Microvirga makkahensis]MXQ12306.1 alpha-ketoglutarate-dependent dioxygenase AlkB [Microvirga makkahensis]